MCVGHPPTIYIYTDRVHCTVLYLILYSFCINHTQYYYILTTYAKHTYISTTVANNQSTSWSAKGDVNNMLSNDIGVTIYNRSPTLYQYQLVTYNLPW